jgi:nitrite reductase (NADH) small subunit
MTEADAGSVSDLEEAKPRRVRVRERDLVLVRLGDRVFALRDSCPHMSTSFEGGAVVARAGGTADEVEFQSEDPVLICPWHQYEFSITTGKCLTSSTWRVRTYPVAVRDGRIFVQMTG